jgi:predicted GIY-YIG superfamily endonuclease
MTSKYVGTIYLLHFDRPYKHARHYLGWAANLQARLAEHAAGRGARLLAVLKQAGIGWTLARTWTGTRARERALKNQGGASRRCPMCGVQPRTDNGLDYSRPIDNTNPAATTPDGVELIPVTGRGTTVEKGH